MKIQIIATGSSKWERFICRWGVSFLIGENVLFDTFGAPSVLFNNIRKFGIDVAKITCIVLSHDHCDHVAGLSRLLEDRKDITVCICPSFRRELKETIISYGAKIVEVNKKILIQEGLYSTGELPGVFKGCTIYEQAVVIKTTDGLSVICGCAHPGVINILEQVRAQFQENIHLLLGGFHLKDNTKEDYDYFAKNVRALGVATVAPTHCTGRLARECLRREYGNNYIEVFPGRILEI